MTKKKAGVKKPQTQNNSQKGTAQASTDAGAVNEVAKAKEEEAAKAKAAEETKAGKKEKDTRPIFKDDRGLEFRFKKNAPKTLNIDGKSTKISEIIQTPEIMLELIYGNSNFIEQIY